MFTLTMYYANAAPETCTYATEREAREQAAWEMRLPTDYMVRGYLIRPI